MALTLLDANQFKGYDFAPLSPGGSLIAGSNTITLPGRVPAGVNGANVKYSVYISGGTGTAEAVLVTGGTAVSGGTTGTLIVTCTYAHSGAWTLTSATCGFAEAAYVAHAAGGGVVYMPPGSHQLRAAIPFMDNLTFQGVGVSTVLIPASSSATVFDANIPVKGTTEYLMVADNIVFRDFLIDAHTYTGVNSVYGIKQINETASTEVWSLYGVLIQNVHFNNVFHSIYFTRSRGVLVKDCWLWCNSQFTFYDSTANTTYHSVYIMIDGLNYAWHPIDSQTVVASMTSSVLNFLNCESCYVCNSTISLPGAASNTGAAYAVTFAGTGEDFKFINNEVQNAFTAIFFGASTISAVLYYPGFFSIIGNSFDGVWGPTLSFSSGDSTAVGHQVAHGIIADNFFTNQIIGQGATPRFINTGTYTRHVSLVGNTFGNVYGSSSQTAITIGANANDIRFDSTNQFVSETTDVMGSTAIDISSSSLGVYGTENLTFSGFGTGLGDAAATVASSSGVAGVITLPAGRRTITITGTTGITGITAIPAGIYVSLLFTGNLTVTDGSNLKLTADFVSGAGGASVLSLYSDGTNFIEVARAIN